MFKGRKMGILLSYLQLGLNMVCGLILSAFLLRTLGDAEYGMYQTIASFANYLVMLEFGTGTVMARNVALSRKYGQDSIQRNFATVSMISYMLTLLILAAAAVFYLNIGSIYKNSMTAVQITSAKRIFLFLTFYIIVTYLEQNYSGFLLAVEEYSFSKIVSIVKITVRTILLVLIISKNRAAIYIAIVDFCLGTAVLMLSRLYCRRKYHTRVSLRAFDREVFLASVPLCFALLLQTVINQANNNVDKFVIGIMMDMKSVAVYSIAQYIFTMFSSIGTVAISMYLPEVASNVQSGKCGRELTNTLLPACRLSTVICGTVMCGFFAVGRPFITLLYGADKIVAWGYAMIIIIPQFLNLTNSVIINVLDVLNKRIVRSLALLGTTIANIALTVILIRPLGILGAVAATSVTLLIGNVIVMNLYYQKYLGIEIPYLFRSAYRGLLIYQLLSAGAAFLLARAIPSPLLAFFVGGSCYLLLSFLLIYYLGLNAQEKERVQKVLRKVVKKG